MNKVTPIESKTGSSGSVSPIQALQQAIEKIESGELDAEKCLVLLDTGTHLEAVSAQTDYNDIVTMLELAKLMFLMKLMGRGHA